MDAQCATKYALIGSFDYVTNFSNISIKIGFFGIIFALLNVFMVDAKAVLENGWFQGITRLVLVIIVLGALGGLVIAAGTEL